MTPGIIAPLVILPIALALFWRWYHRSFRRGPSDGERQISGVRLTAEALHRLGSPPWRVVHEIGDRLPDVDHVVVAPAGVVAIRTSAVDRPTVEQLVEHRPMAAVVAESAVTRGGVDELLRDVGASCGLLARVYWGRPDAHRHAAEESIHATALVEGQRLTEWLEDWNTHAPAVLDTAGVDRVWRAVAIGIGRPDPTA